MVTFGYVDASANRTRREVEPLRLVHARGVYYLVAHDRGRAALRTFRVDRIEARGVTPSDERFTPAASGAELDAWIAQSIEGRPAPCVGELALQGRYEDLAPALPRWLGELSPLDAGRTRLVVRAESLDALVAMVVYVGREVEVLSPPSLAEAFAAVAARLSRAAVPLRP